MFVESKLGFIDLPDDFDFDGSYREELFRGHIESHEAAMHIMKALRLDGVPPQMLSTGADGKLRCDFIESR